MSQPTDFAAKCLLACTVYSAVVGKLTSILLIAVLE